MQFKVYSELEYQVLMPSTFIFNIQVSRTSSQTVLEELITIHPNYPMESFTSQDGKTRFIRVQINDLVTFKIVYSATVDTRYKITDVSQHINNLAIATLDADVIPYIFPSRYCQSDKLQKLAYKEFGWIENHFQKVVAINDWIFYNVEYIVGSTNSGTSALDTLTERAGVCRDFAHLGIALCRALSIPARYFTCYSYKLYPQNFHACFEAYIGGEWLLFDPTMLAPLNGMIKIANGRDAADASVASIFGNAYCNLINVQCDCIDSNYQPYSYQNNKNTQAISYQ
jgi:transglutaminase-like putative cysteine protease